MATKSEVRTSICRKIVAREDNFTAWPVLLRRLAEELMLPLERIGWHVPALDMQVQSVIDEALKQSRTLEQIQHAAEVAL